MRAHRGSRTPVPPPSRSTGGGERAVRRVGARRGKRPAARGHASPARTRMHAAFITLC